MGSCNALNRVRKERAHRTETKFPVWFCLRFLRASDRAPVRPILPAARGNIALRTIDRQRRKERSGAQERNEQSCEYAAQSVLRVQQRSNPSNNPSISYESRVRTAFDDDAVAGRSFLAQCGKRV